MLPVITPHFLALTRLWNHARWMALIVVATFVGGFGLALGGLAALKLLGWLLVTWGCR